MIETLPSGTILRERYRIERVLGSGGFGHVYLAVDMQTNQQYALKEYLVTGASGQEQLTHESNVLSQLHHPNLPAFHDAFNERGRFYGVLNYIEGHDLTDLIRLARQHNDAVPIARIMHWILSICDAVIFLHSQRPQIIHRDIKPDNIRITSDGTAILVDLGNAKAAADGARTLFFIRHQGTPGYAPLEQYPGGSGTDARSDVYALGGTLYFALTGHEPPSVSSRQSSQTGPDVPSLQQRLANNPPEDNGAANALRQFRLGVTKPGKPAPRHSRHLAQLGTLPPELLNQLNAIIQKAMAMKPKDRYQSVAEFAHDLKAVLDAMPSVAPTSTEPRQINPNSTQPDLPMLYEALQTAKDKAASSTANAQAGAASPVQVSMNCPRCNTPLTPQAAYCTRCGLALTPPSPQQTPGASIAGGSGGAAFIARSLPTDIAAEQTMIITPKRQEVAGQARTSVKTDQPTATPSMPAQPVDPAQLPTNKTSTPPVPLVQMRPTHSTAQANTFTNIDTPVEHEQDIKLNMRLLIVMIVIVVILLVIMVLLLTHNHPPTGMSGGYSWLLRQIQGGLYERNISFRAASATTHPLVRVWQRGTIVARAAH